MNIKVDSSESSFKQLDYFSIANWKKLETLSIYIRGESLNIENIENKFDFPLLQKL